MRTIAHSAVRAQDSSRTLLIKTSDRLVVLSLSLAGSLTQVIKITVGRPRPGKTQRFRIVSCPWAIDMLCLDLISRCNPDSGVVDPTFGLSTVAICHQSDRHIINDGFKSFPSGHSSSAAYLEHPKRCYSTDIVPSVFCRIDLFILIYCWKVAFV